MAFFHSHETEPFPRCVPACICVQPLGYMLTCAKIEFALICCSLFDFWLTNLQHSCRCRQQLDIHSIITMENRMPVAMLTFPGDNFRLTQSISLLIKHLTMRVSVVGYLSAEQVLLWQMPSSGGLWLIKGPLLLYLIKGLCNWPKNWKVCWWRGWVQSRVYRKGVKKAKYPLKMAVYRG